MRLEGKIAIITGAASGMGRAASMVFAAEGASVVAADINVEGGEATAEGIRSNGGICTFVAADVTDEAQVRSLVEGAVADHGKLDVMYNNAGGGGANDDVVDMSEEQFDAMVALNLKGMFFGTKHALRQMLPNDGGSIISTASIAGLRGSDHVGMYGATKAGVINLTRYVAWAYGPRGVRANCVCPGAINTPKLQGGVGDPGYDRVSRYYRHEAPLQRVGEPEDIAHAALFFASDESKYVTGQILSVDGGMMSGSFLDGERLRAMAEDLLS